MAASTAERQGGDGGDIEMMAGTTLTTSLRDDDGPSATGDAGSGGDIEHRVAVGDIIVAGERERHAERPPSAVRTNSPEATAATTILLGQRERPVNGKITRTVPPAGIGGTVDWEAATDLSFSKTNTVQADGIDGGGGDVFLFAGGTLSLSQQVDARGFLAAAGRSRPLRRARSRRPRRSITDGQVAGGSIF